MLKKCWFTKSAGAGAKCDHLKLEVRSRVRAHLSLDVRGACVRPKKRSQLIPWKFLPRIKGKPIKFRDFFSVDSSLENSWRHVMSSYECFPKVQGLHQLNPHNGLQLNFQMSLLRENTDVINNYTIKGNRKNLNIQVESFLCFDTFYVMRLCEVEKVSNSWSGINFHYPKPQFYIQLFIKLLYLNTQILEL